jgi:hypothetical protein
MNLFIGSGPMTVSLLVAACPDDSPDHVDLQRSRESSVSSDLGDAVEDV